MTSEIRREPLPQRALLDGSSYATPDRTGGAEAV
jgi:hypothetical protein